MKAGAAAAACAAALVGLWLSGGLGYGFAGVGAAARALGQARAAPPLRPADAPRAAAHQFEYAPAAEPESGRSCRGRRWERRGFPSRRACEEFERRR